MYEVRISKLENMFEDLTKRANEGDEKAKSERSKVYEELVRLRRLKWEDEHETASFDDHDY